jgi:hypothetical protein
VRSALLLQAYEEASERICSKNFVEGERTVRARDGDCAAADKYPPLRPSRLSYRITKTCPTVDDIEKRVVGAYRYISTPIAPETAEAFAAQIPSLTSFCFSPYD